MNCLARLDDDVVSQSYAVATVPAIPPRCVNASSPLTSLSAALGFKGLYVDLCAAIIGSAKSWLRIIVNRKFFAISI